MATYTAAQLYGTGSIGEDLSGASTFAFINPNDSSYFTLETIPNATGSYAGAPTNALGTWVVSASMGFVSSSYVASVVVQPGSSSLTFTPTASVTGTTYRLRGTGTYGLIIGSALLLDIYSDAAAAYSLRKLRTAYAGSAIRVRRSSDNTESDIGFNSGGGLNTTALTTFVSAGSGFITTWYDQSGLGRHAIQTTAALQPRIVNAGAVETVNGKPAVFINGVNSLDATITFSTSQMYSHVSVHKINNINAGTFVHLINWTGGVIQGPYMYYVDGRIYSPSSGNDMANHGLGTNTMLEFMNWTFGGVNDDGIQQLMIYTTNGVNRTINFNKDNLQTNTINIPFYNGVAASSMYVQERIFYNQDQAASQNGLQSNINSYYSIY